MELIINESTRVYLEASSRFYSTKLFYLQYKKMILNGANEWVLDENAPNSEVELIAEGDEYDAFIALTEQEQMEFFTAHLQTILPEG